MLLLDPSDTEWRQTQAVDQQRSHLTQARALGACPVSDIAALAATPPALTVSTLSSPSTKRNMAKRATPEANFTPRKVRCLNTEAPKLATAALTIIAGNAPNEETFLVHDNLLKQHSKFFSAALKAGWKEAERHLVRLPDEKPEEVRQFVNFVYYGKLFVAETKSESEAEEERLDRIDREFEMLENCWCVGERLMSLNFQDAVSDALLDLVTKEARFPSEMHERIYAISSGPRAFKRLLVDFAVFAWHKRTHESLEANASNSRFLQDLSLRFRQAWTQKESGSGPYNEPIGCNYHEHVAAGTPCYKTLFPE